MISAFEEYRLAALNLYAEAGKPSFRKVADQAAVSPSTVHKMLRADQRLPTLDSVLRIVEALDGDEARFQRLWRAAAHELTEGVQV